MTVQKNVLGTELKPCSFEPLTGVLRDGYCKYVTGDYGEHIVAAKVSSGFLEWNKKRGNDLITPRPEHQFTGLKEGDWWCICMNVWIASKDAGHPLFLKLESCHEKMLEHVALEDLKTWEYKS